MDGRPALTRRIQRYVQSVSARIEEEQELAARCQVLCARKYAREERRNSMLLKIVISFGKLLEIKFAFFAKILRMTTLLGKLLEML